MILGTLNGSRRERVTTDSGSVAVHRNYIITSPLGGQPSPQAYLVEQAPNATLRSHFHFNSQFQIFMHGGGTIGRHRAQPYVVQYAARQTGYGPIVAGEEGLAYLTLRPTTISQRAQYLPESKEMLDRSLPKRQVVSEPIEAAGMRETLVRPMIEPAEDGLAAWFLHVPSGTRSVAPELPEGSGRFYVVVAGELATAQGPAKALSVLWTEAHEAPLELEASGSPVDVIVAQFPRGAW